MTSILFNSFLITAFSFISGDDIEEKNYYTSIIMMSYPNSKDIEINAINYFPVHNNYFPLKEIIENKISIDNNIFGLIKKGIIFQLFPKNNNNEIIITLLCNNIKINENEIIEKNEEIEFFFPNSSINQGTYRIEYAGVVTEPDYDIYNTYCEIDSDNGNITQEETELEKIDYIGRTGYIYINFSETFINNCTNIDCLYCLEDNPNNCILFKKGKKEEGNAEEKTEEENTELKTELDTEEKTELKTELKTDLETEENTELKTEEKTIENTELKTEVNTELKTEENTELKTAL